MHEIHKLNKAKTFQQTPSNKRHILPSILNSKIPKTLLKLCRQIKENKINNEDFILSIKRRHRMHIMERNKPITCKCGTNIDSYGNHLFSCTYHSKMKLHNHIRNTIHVITQNIGTHTNFIKSKDACQKEETGLISTYPSIHLGDITLHPTMTSNNKIQRIIIAIDCTITE